MFISIAVLLIVCKGPLLFVLKYGVDFYISKLIVVEGARLLRELAVVWRPHRRIAPRRLHTAPRRRVPSTEINIKV
jgi:hypothetical protein